MLMNKNAIRLSILAVAVMACSLNMQAGSLAILCSEGGDATCAGEVAAMQATGKFSSVTGIDTTLSTPTLSSISGYGSILAETNLIPSDATGLGNVLASYYSLGGKHLTVATYAFSNPWAIGGTLATGGYSALTNLGINGDVSGILVATVPNDPIFAGIDLNTLTYFHNLNFAHPGLASGATLLATDGSGVDMIARSSLGVIDFNLYPGATDVSGNNAEFYDLLANTLGGTSTPEPGTLVMFGSGMVGLAGLLRRKLRV
jgi:hypothetical protein